MFNHTCRVDKCRRGIYSTSSQLCTAHYQQYRAGREFSEPRGGWEPTGVCDFDQCGQPRAIKTLCRRHYDQLKRSGEMSPLELPRIPAATRNENGEKWCRSCRVWKAEAAFASSKRASDGLQGACRECRSAHYRRNAESVRDRMREQRFGISREKFDALFESQGNLCAICRGDDPGTNFWAVDHDHACCPGSDKTCGKCIRGILCSRCNHALGHARDSVEILSAMIDYLGKAA